MTALQWTLLMASTLTIMAGATISPALPAMATHFDGTAHLDWLIRLLLTIPSLAIVLCSPIAGWLLDRFNRTHLLIAGAMLYVVAGTSGLWLDSLPALLVGRALLGVSVALVMTAATTLIGALFDGEERARFMGTQAAAMSLGGVVFLAAGGLLGELSWRGPFALYLGAIAVVVMAIKYLPRDTRPVRLQGQATDPLPVKLMTLLMTLNMLAMAVFYLIPVQLPFYLASAGLTAPAAAGGVMSAMTVMAAIASLNYGRLAKRLSPMGIFVIGFAWYGLCIGAIGLADHWIGISAAVIASGLALGLLMPNAMGWLNRATPPSRRGQANGLLVMSMFLGHFLSPFASVPIVASVGYSAVYLAGGAVCALVVLTLLILPNPE